MRSDPMLCFLERCGAVQIDNNNGLVIDEHDDDEEMRLAVLLVFISFKFLCFNANLLIDFVQAKFDCGSIFNFLKF